MVFHKQRMEPHPLGQNGWNWGGLKTRQLREHPIRGHNLAHEKLFQNSNRSRNPPQLRCSNFRQAIWHTAMAMQASPRTSRWGTRMDGHTKIGGWRLFSHQNIFSYKEPVAETWVVTCEKRWLLIISFSNDLVLSIFSIVHRITTASFKVKTTTISSKLTAFVTEVLKSKSF